MDPQIAVAVIGGLFGIASPIITYVAIHAYKDRFLIALSEGRRKALDGKWQGSMHQEVGPDGNPCDADFSLQLTTSRKAVKGEGSSDFQFVARKYEARFTVTGGFLHDRFLKFDYKNRDETALHFGSMMLELSADGRLLNGRFVGYGSVSQRLVYGSINLAKQV